MIPIGAILAGIAAAQANRRPRTQAPLLSIAWVLAPVAVLVGAVLWGPPGAILPAIVFLPFLFPWTFTRWCLVPLGLSGTASWLASRATIVWMDDLRTGPVVAAAWALLHRNEHQPRLAEKLSLQIERRVPFVGSSLLGSGLLAASRGDLVSARKLMGSVSMLDPKACVSLARRLASEWLMADAAAEGDWDAVRRFSHRRGPFSSTSMLLAGVAARRLGAPYRFAAIRLVAWWLLSGRWLSAWPLLCLGLFGKRSATVAPAAPVSLDDPLQLALTFHALVLRAGDASLTPARLVAAGLAWDAALDAPALESRVRERSVVLAQLSPEEALQRLRVTAAADLAQALLDTSLPFEEWTGRSQILDDVAGRLRNSLLEQIEGAARRLADRVNGKRPLPVVDEWREYLDLCDQCERAALLGGLESRRFAFAAAHPAIASLAIWLYNKREERPLGNAMFRWLAVEAEAVGDIEAAKLQSKNAAIGI